MRTACPAWVLLLVLTTACSTASTPSPAPITSTTGAPPSAVPTVSTVSGAPSTPQATLPAVALPSMQPLSADSFNNPTLVHEFWPDVQKAAKLYETIRFGPSATSFALSPDGRYVAVAGCDAEAGSTEYFGAARCEETGFQSVSHAYGYVFDAANGEVVATLPETGEALTIYSLGFTHDGQKLLYIVHDKVIQVWDLQTSRLEASITQEDANYASYEISPDDRLLMISFDFQPIQIWDLQTHEHVDDLPGFGYPTFSPDGLRMAVDQGPYLIMYDTRDWHVLSKRAVLPNGSNYDITNDFSLIAVCDSLRDNDPILVWDLATVSVRATLRNPYGECRTLSFTPDGKYLLLFNENGVGPMVWSAPAWELVGGTGYNTTFVHGDDRFVDRPQYSQDQSLVLVPTAARLTLYSLPAGEASALAAEPAPASQPPAAAATVLPPMHCDIKVTGAIRLQTQPCEQQWARAGLHMQGRMRLELVDQDLHGVVIYFSNYLEQSLKPGTYPIWDITQPVRGNPDAELLYFDVAQTLTGPYESYEGTGDLVLTAVGDVLSGTFKFGARNEDHLEVNVEGSFENIPYIHTFPP